MNLSYDAEDSTNYYVKETEMHPCSDAELGLNGSSTSKFYSDIS